MSEDVSFGSWNTVQLPTGSSAPTGSTGWAGSSLATGPGRPSSILRRLLPYAVLAAVLVGLLILVLNSIADIRASPTTHAAARARCPVDAFGNSCGGNGVCVNGVCICDGGYEGEGCMTRVLPCPAAVDPASDDPELAQPEECAGHGACRHGVCACDAGFGGADCAQVLDLCPTYKGRPCNAERGTCCNAINTRQAGHVCHGKAEGVCVCGAAADGSGDEYGGAACQHTLACPRDGGGNVCGGEAAGTCCRGDACADGNGGHLRDYSCRCAPGKYGVACDRDDPTDCPAAANGDVCNGPTSGAVCDTLHGVCATPVPQGTEGARAVPAATGAATVFVVDGCPFGFGGAACDRACETDGAGLICSAYVPPADRSVPGSGLSRVPVMPHPLDPERSLRGACEYSPAADRMMCVCDSGYGETAQDAYGRGTCEGCATGFRDMYVEGAVSGAPAVTEALADAGPEDTTADTACVSACPGTGYFVNPSTGEREFMTCFGNGECVEGTCVCKSVPNVEFCSQNGCGTAVLLTRDTGAVPDDAVSTGLGPDEGVLIIRCVEHGVVEADGRRAGASWLPFQCLVLNQGTEDDRDAGVGPSAGSLYLDFNVPAGQRAWLATEKGRRSLGGGYLKLPFPGGVSVIWFRTRSGTLNLPTGALAARQGVGGIFEVDVSPSTVPSAASLSPSTIARLVRATLKNVGSFTKHLVFHRGSLRVTPAVPEQPTDTDAGKFYGPMPCVGYDEVSGRACFGHGEGARAGCDNCGRCSGPNSRCGGGTDPATDCAACLADHLPRALDAQGREVDGESGLVWEGVDEHGDTVEREYVRGVCQPCFFEDCLSACQVVDEAKYYARTDGGVADGDMNAALLADAQLASPVHWRRRGANGVALADIAPRVVSDEQSDGDIANCRGAGEGACLRTFTRIHMTDESGAPADANLGDASRAPAAADVTSMEFCDCPWDYRWNGGPVANAWCEPSLGNCCVATAPDLRQPGPDWSNHCGFWGNVPAAAEAGLGCQFLDASNRPVDAVTCGSSDQVKAECANGDREDCGFTSVTCVCDAEDRRYLFANPREAPNDAENACGACATTAGFGSVSDAIGTSAYGTTSLQQLSGRGDAISVNGYSGEPIVTPITPETSFWRDYRDLGVATSFPSACCARSCGLVAGNSSQGADCSLPDGCGGVCPNLCHALEGCKDDPLPSENAVVLAGLDLSSILATVNGEVYDSGGVCSANKCRKMKRCNALDFLGMAGFVVEDVLDHFGLAGYFDYPWPTECSQNYDGRCATLDEFTSTYFSFFSNLLKQAGFPDPCDFAIPPLPYLCD